MPRSGVFLGPGTAVLIAACFHLLHDDGTGHFTDPAVAPAQNRRSVDGLAFGESTAMASMILWPHFGTTDCDLPSRTNWATSRPGVSRHRTAPFRSRWAIFVFRPWWDRWIGLRKQRHHGISLSRHICGLVIVTDNPAFTRNDGGAFPVRPNGFAQPTITGEKFLVWQPATQTTMAR